MLKLRLRLRIMAMGVEQRVFETVNQVLNYRISELGF